MSLKENTCAGFVLYNPDINLLDRNISIVIAQVDHIYIVDNGSDNISNIKILLNKYENIDFECLETNKGIAYALNKIFDFAKKNQYEWFLTMDQDSLISSELISTYSQYIDNKKNALICPFVLSNGKYTLEAYKNLKLAETNIITAPIDCLTSACLNRTSVIEEVGGYADELFIDYVDVDLNCRVMLMGYNILRVNKVYMIQNVGIGKDVPIFRHLYQLTRFEVFRRLQKVAVYNDIRLYYSARNSKIVYKRYNNAGIRLSGLFMFLLFSFYTLTYPLKRSRLLMWKNIIKGYIDSREYI